MTPPDPLPPEGLLTPEEYQLLAAPALETAAQLAAQRGDPHLFNDMPTMLALLGMVSALTYAHLERVSSLPEASTRATLEAAPLAVCTLVFTRSGLTAGEVRQCIEALSAAFLQLLRQGVLGAQGAFVETAYEQLLAGDRPAALRSLRKAAQAIVGAVDAWEASQAAVEGN